MPSAYSNLKISVQALKGEKLFCFEEPVGSFPMLVSMAESSSCQFLSPVTINLKLYRVNDMYRGEGDVATSVRFQCSRCLEDFVYPVYAEFDLNFSAEPDSTSDSCLQGEYEVRAEQAGLVSFSDDEIDLTEPMQDQVLMALPIRPLCREDCRGLCPQCGIDLNFSSCGCEKIVFNPKFQNLAELDVKKKKEK